MFPYLSVRATNLLMDDYIINEEFRRIMEQLDEDNLLSLERDPETTDVKIIHKISTFVRIVTFIPFELQLLIIRFLQPFVLGGIIVGYQSIGYVYMSIILVIVIILVSMLYKRYLNNTKFAPLDS